MSFDIDVERRLGEARVRARIVAGEGVTAVTGRSGAGKTSLLNMVAGLLRPDRGTIRVGGRTLFGEGVDLPPEERRAGYVFQDARLFPHLRVRANLLYGRRDGPALIGLDEAVALLGLEGLLDRWPRTLSGGEAKRVAIGRALLSAPRFLLMDEPLASLDQARADEVMAALLRLRESVRLPILYVTHDPAEVARLADRTVELSR